MATTHKISPNLWFDNNAEEAAKYYTSIFKNSKIISTSHYGKEGHETHHMPEGSVLTVVFELNGTKFTALNGGPVFKFNESISFMIYCDTQEEIDYYWDKLKEGGDPKAQVCGWLKDKFGVSWQVAPTIAETYLEDSPNEKSERFMKAMMKMKKLDIAELEKAYRGDRVAAEVE